MNYIDPLEHLNHRKYKAILFDWDGTAVVTRDSPVDELLWLMTELLESGILLCVISGAPYREIAQGRIHERIPKTALHNLYLGLERGAFNYGFNGEGDLITLHEVIPDSETRIRMHELVFSIHKQLLLENGLNSNIHFAHPNHCMIDLLVDVDRGDELFIHPGEVELLNQKLDQHGYEGGIARLLEDSVRMGEELGLEVKATTDAKFLEVGMTTKADNVDFLLETVVFVRGIKIEKCCFWGDEFTSLGSDVYGNDAQMITSMSEKADFYDVSEAPQGLPENVQSVGGGVCRFAEFLKEQINP